MSLIKITEDINHPRRRFLGTGNGDYRRPIRNARFREGRNLE